MVDGKMDILKVLVKCISITVLISKALLLKAKSLEKTEYISIQMDHIKEVKLKMEDSMERELLLAPLDLNMRDNGQMTNLMVKEFKHIQMAPSTGEALFMESNKMTTQFISGQMESNIMDLLEVVIWKAKENYL